MYSKDNPYKVYRPSGEVAKVRQEFTEWCRDRGGVAVWAKALIEPPYGAEMLTPQNDEDGTATKCPGWQWGRSPRVVITDREAIEVLPLAVTRLVTRQYMPLHLFLAASRDADVADVTLSVVGPDGEIEEVGADEFADWLARAGQGADDGNSPRIQAVKLWWSREAYNGGGFREGTEQYVATFEVVPKGENDHYPMPNPAAAWMVRVDTVDTELVYHPEEPTVVWGYMTSDAGFLAHADELDDTSWMRGVEVDGEFLTEEEFEQWDGGYCPPEGDFIWEEGNHRLERIIGIGAHDVWNAEDKRFYTLDAYGVRIDD